jgi:hypothetical protein
LLQQNAGPVQDQEEQLEDPAENAEGQEDRHQGSGPLP